MTDVFAKGIADLKLPDFAGDVPAPPKLQQPTSLDILREAGMANANGSRRSIDVAGDLIRMERDAKKAAETADPMLAIPSWQQAIAGIQGGYDNLSYDQKKQAHDAYVQRAVAELRKVDTKTDPLLLEQKVLEQAPPPVDPTEGRGDYMRGLAQRLPQAKGLAAGAIGYALTKLGFKDTGREFFDTMKAYDKESGALAKQNDTFTEALKPDGSLADYLQYQAGQMTGNLIEGVATAVVGGVVGGAAGAGVGALPGAAAGFVSKSLVKKGLRELIEKEMKDTVEKQVANGVAREVAVESAKQAAEIQLRKATGKALGQVAGIYAYATTQGLGEIVQQAEAAGIDPGSLGLAKTMSSAALYGAAEGLSDKILLGAFGGTTGNVVKRTLKKGATTAAAEGSTEVVQDVITKLAGAGVAPEFIDLINAFAAGATGGGMAGALGGALRGQEGEADPGTPGAANPTAVPGEPEMTDEELAATPADEATVAPGTTTEFDGATLVMGENGQWAYTEGSPTSPLADVVLASQAPPAGSVAAAGSVTPVTPVTPVAPTQQQPIIDGLPEEVEAIYPPGFTDQNPDSWVLVQTDGQMFEGATPEAAMQAYQVGLDGGLPQDALPDTIDFEPEQTVELDANGDVVLADTAVPFTPAMARQIVEGFAAQRLALFAGGRPTDELRQAMDAVGLSGAERETFLDTIARAATSGVGFGDIGARVEELYEGAPDTSAAAPAGRAIGERVQPVVRERTAVPALSSISTMINGSPDTTAQMQSTRDWYFQPGAVVEGVLPEGGSDSLAVVLDYTPGGRDSWSATVQPIRLVGSGYEVQGPPVTVNRMPTYGNVLRSIPTEFLQQARQQSPQAQQEQPSVTLAGATPPANLRNRPLRYQRRAMSFASPAMRAAYIARPNSRASTSGAARAWLRSLGLTDAQVTELSTRVVEAARREAQRTNGQDFIVPNVALPGVTAPTTSTPALNQLQNAVEGLRAIGSEVFEATTDEVDGSSLRGLQPSGALGQLISSTASTAERHAHFSRAMQAAMDSLNRHDARHSWRFVEGRRPGSWQVELTPHTGGSRVIAADGSPVSSAPDVMHISSTGFSYVSGRGEEGAAGGRFYDALYGALASSRLKPYLSGLTDSNKRRMPINRLRAILKWGTILRNPTLVDELLSMEAAGPSNIPDYRRTGSTATSVLDLLNRRAIEQFGSIPVLNEDGTYTLDGHTMTRTELRDFVRNSPASRRNVKLSPDEVAITAVAKALSDGRSAESVARSFIDTNLSQGPMLFSFGQKRSRLVTGLRQSLNRYREGRLDGQQLAEDVARLTEEQAQLTQARQFNQLTRDRARGADWLRERLIRARRQEALDADAVEAALWLIDQNPSIANDLGISLREGTENSPAGSYDPINRVVRLFTSSIDSRNTTTTVHEILHHTERFMPVDVQEGILQAYNREIERALRTATPQEASAIIDLIAGSYGDRQANERAMKAFANGTLDYDTHYQLANPSEFWAVNATNILVGRYNVQGSWVGKAKQWLTELIQKVRDALGLRSNASVIRGLQAVLNGKGERLSRNMLAQLHRGREATYNDINIEEDAANPEVDNDIRPQKRTSTASVIDAIRTGKPASPSTAGRGMWQAWRAGDKVAFKKARLQFYESINRELHDASVDMKRWLQTLPENETLTGLLKQSVIGSMYTARKKRDDVLRRMYDEHLAEIDKLLNLFADKHKISLETAVRDIGLVTTAKTIPARNAFLLRKRIKAIAALQKQLDDAIAEQQTASTEGMVPEAQAAAAAAPVQTTNVEALQAQLSKAQAQLTELVAAINNQNIRVKKHGGGGVAGMNNAQAKAMLDAARERYGDAGYAEIEAIAKRTYDMNAAKLALDIESGKTSPAVAVEFLEKPAALQVLQELRDLANAVDASNKASVDALNAKRKEAIAAVWTEYVPLSGDPRKDIDDSSFHGGSGIPNVQRDYELLGRERGSPPDDGLSTSRAALMKSASYYGWRDFQDGIAAIHRAMTKEQRDAYGLRAEAVEPGRSTLSNKAVIRHRNGKTTAFIFEDETLIDAIRGASRLENNVLLEGAGKITKAYSYLATQANPFFAPFNFIRDSWERSELVRTRSYLRADGSKADSASISWRMLKNLLDPELITATARYALGKPANTNSRMGRYLEEFLRQGGVSVYSSQFGADRAKMIAQISKQKSWRQQLGTLSRWVETYNKTFDVGPALASYMAMRDAGMNTKDAAAGALDLMDFGKRGKSASVFASIYAFAQPTFTGAANLVASTFNDPLTGKPNKVGMTRLAAYVGGFLMLQAFLRSLADDDEGGNKLDQQSDFTKNNFLLIPAGDGMIKVPLAYGMARVANGIARAALNVGTNEQSAVEALGNFAGGSVVPVFSPIEDSDIDWFERPAQALMTLFAPSWLKPPLALATNTTPFDTQIVNAKYGDPKKFKSEQYGRYAPEVYKDMAVALRQMTGIDMAPEELRYVFRAYPTGILQLGINGPMEGKSVGEAAKNKVYANYSEFARYFQFKKALDETDDLLKRVNAGEAVTDPMERRKLMWRLQWDETDKELRAAKGKATRAATKAGVKPDAIDGRFGDQRMAAQVRALYYYRLMQGKDAVVGEPPDLSK